MASTLDQAAALSKREVFYQRHRTKNRVFAAIASFFAEEAQAENITKREIARRLSCDPSQITRWLSAPSNMTIEGVSDILLSLGAEADLNIVKFENRPAPNYVHPLIEATFPGAQAQSIAPTPPPAVVPAPIYVIVESISLTTSAMVAGSVYPNSAPITGTIGTSVYGSAYGLATYNSGLATYSSLGGVLVGHEPSHNAGVLTWSNPQVTQPQHHQSLGSVIHNIAISTPIPTKLA
jgi:hypothetical protein